MLILSGLDIEEFREAVKEIMGNIENEDIDVMFMKVDSNCDGSVVWVMLLSCIIRDNAWQVAIGKIIS